MTQSQYSLHYCTTWALPSIPTKVKLTVHALFRSSGNYELARLSRASLQVSIFPRFHIASLIDYCSYIEHVFFFFHSKRFNLFKKSNVITLLWYIRFNNAVITIRLSVRSVIMFVDNLLPENLSSNRWIFIER